MKSSSQRAQSNSKSLAVWALTAIAFSLLSIHVVADKSASEAVIAREPSQSSSVLFAGPHSSLLGSLLFAPPAATITVNSTLQSPGGSGDCTLGEAILAANANGPVDGCTPGTLGGFDTIILPAGTYNLTTVNNTNPRVGPVGLPLILSDIIIQGEDAATTIIRRDPNAAADFGLLALIDDPIGSLVLNDVTLRGGRGFGQAIGLQRGGGVYVGNRTVVLNRVTFDANIATQGGAIGSFGFATVTANNCTFTNNRATNSVGGAIEARTLTVTHSTFIGNRALTDGGAINFIASSAAIANISDSVFINNSVDVGNGGAVRLFGQVTISNSTFDGNSALGNVGTAGAIEAIGTVNISDSVITNNHARDAGGGIFTGGAVYSITRTNISNNTSLNRGGGLYITDGGATSTGAISNSTISNNTVGVGVGDGGGIYVSNAKTLNFTNVTIEGNNATRDGGGIFYFDGNDTRVAALNNVTLTGNHAARDAGGLYRFSGGDIRFKNTIIALNTSGINSGHDIWATLLTSLGYNLVGIKDGANFINTSGDQTGTAAAPLNPLLGPLQANGGPTLTRALLAGSPAMDSANPAPPGSGGNSCETLDQRGTIRPQDGDGNGSQICDIGAVENGAPQSGQFQFNAATYNVGEGANVVSVEVQRVNGTEGAASVTASTGDNTATAGSDYIQRSITLDFAHGETTKTFDVTISEDQLDEFDEEFNLSLTAPTNGASLGTPDTAVVSILDNDEPPAISVNDISVVEGNGGQILTDFTLSLSGPSGKTITIEVTTADSTATTDGNDYIWISSVPISFMPGETTRTAQVRIVGDTILEPDESFFLNLSNPLDATVADAQGQCTILNDDTAPVLSIIDVAVDESNSEYETASFEVSLSNMSSLPVSVDYATRPGTATSGTDYQAVSGTLVLVPGITNKTINIVVWGDEIREPDETYFVTLTNVTNATLARTEATGTIRNDDFAVDLRLSISDSPDPVTLGAELTYNINVLNGRDVATGVVLTDTLPANATFISATPTQGSCSQNGATLICNLGSIAQDNSASVSVVVRPDVAGITLTNSGNVTSNEPDENPADNASSQTTIVQSVADLSLTQTPSALAVTAGNDLSYNLRVHNAGPSPASDAFLTNVLHHSVQFVSASPGCNHSGGTLFGFGGIVTCNIDPLDVGADAQATVVVRAEAAGTISNTAIVRVTGFDSNSNNNIAITSTVVHLAQTAGSNNLITVSKVVDSDGDENRPPRPEEFQLQLTSSPFIQGLSFLGSSTPLAIPVLTSEQGSSFRLRELNPDPSYLPTFSTDCQRGIILFVDDLTSGQHRNCVVTNSYVGALQEPEADTGLKVVTVVNNTGAPTPRQPGDFQQRVASIRSHAVQAGVTFAGAAAGVTVGIDTFPTDNRAPYDDQAFVEAFDVDPNYIVTGCNATRHGDSYSSGIQIIRSGMNTCTLTYTYIGSSLGEQPPNQLLNVSKIVDNTGAPETHQPEEFEFNLGFGSVASLSFFGSSIPRAIGLFQSQTGSPFRLEEINPDREFLVTYSPDCLKGFISFRSLGGDPIIRSGQIKNCVVTNSYVGGRQEPHADTGVKVTTVVDNTGAPTPRQPHEFHQLVASIKNQVVQPGVSFDGSANGVVVGIDMFTGGLTSNSSRALMKAVDVDPNYFVSGCGVTREGQGNSYSNRITPVHSAMNSCTLTYTYIGSSLGEQPPNRFLNVSKLVDNTRAPRPRQPQEFQFSLGFAFGSQDSLSFFGSSVPRAIGLRQSSHLDPGWRLRELNPDPAFLITYSADCLNGSIDFREEIGVLIKNCVVTNSYVGSHQEPEADTGVKVITVVDNTGSPTPRQPQDFQQRVASIRNSPDQTGVVFAGSADGVVVGIDLVGVRAIVQAIEPDPNYMVTGCNVVRRAPGDSYLSNIIVTPGAMNTCTLTYTYIGPRGTETSVGPNVSVQSGGVTIGFEDVRVGGITTGARRNPNIPFETLPSLASPRGSSSTRVGQASNTPETLSVFDNLAFDITTTASVSGPIKVCSQVPYVNTETALARLKLMHLEDGALVDRTVSRDLVTQTLCGSAASLGTFVVVQDVDNALPVISGRITDFDGNGIGDVVMALSGADSRVVTTTPDGGYSFVNLTSGGDYSISPAVNFAVTPASSIFNNLSTSQTANFVPTPPMLAEAATLVNESCAPNGQIDPGERVTVSLRLRNNSNVDTTNLMATLQSGDGVVAPGGPQAYGSILSDEFSQRDFSFTADPSLISGETITATLQLHDGTQNLGAVKFYFTAGSSPCGGVRLVVTSTPLQRSDGAVTTIVSVQNTGTLPADNVVITNAMLSSAAGSVSLPSLGLIDIGASRCTEVTFATAATGASLLKLNGTYGPGVGGSGTLSSTKRVTIP